MDCACLGCLGWPHEWVGFSTDGWLYLWLAEVDPVWGAAAVAFSLTGSLSPVAFELLVDGLWVTSAFPDLLIALPCLTEPTLVGKVLVTNPTLVDAGSWGRTKAHYR